MKKNKSRILVVISTILILFSHSLALELKLVAHDGKPRTIFGSSVAIENNTIFIGAPGYSDEIDYKGAVYVFEGEDFQWNESQKIEASDGGPFELFGYALALSGQHALISARGDSITNPFGGAVYFFEQGQQGSWEQIAKFTSPHSSQTDLFGLSVDIDGSYAIIGAPLDGGITSSSGSAYIYKYDDGQWQLESKIFPAQGNPFDNFGSSVSISGNRVIVGACGSNVKQSGVAQCIKFAGTAYIFERQTDGWQQVSRLVPIDSNSGNLFGCSVSLDGDYAIVGACQDNVSEFNSGSAYIYKKENDGWAVETKLVATDADSGDFFGAAVKISQDYIVVGAPGVNGLGKNSGAVYSFLQRDGQWVPRAKKTPYDAARNDIFGASLAMSQDFSVVGAPLKSVQENRLQGAAYIYDNIQDLALPVELTSFSAQYQEDSIVLRWVTQSEKDNLGFIVERKVDDEWSFLASFQTDDALRGQGSRSMPSYYEFFDDSISANTTYHYRLADVNMSGAINYHQAIEIAVSAGISRHANLPTTMVVFPAFPNPFNPQTIIRYDLPQTAFVTIGVFDLTGRQVRALLSQEQIAGLHTINWNGRDDNGEQVGSGIYLLRICADNFMRSQKVSLIR